MCPCARVARWRTRFGRACRCRPRSRALWRRRLGRLAPCQGGPPWPAAGRAALARARALQRPPRARTARRMLHARPQERQGAAQAQERRRRLEPGRPMRAAVQRPQRLVRRGQIRVVSLVGVDFLSAALALFCEFRGDMAMAWVYMAVAEHEDTKPSTYQPVRSTASSRTPTT